MAKFNFILWENTKYCIQFEAEDLEDAKKLLAEAEDEMDWEILPEAEQFFKKGDETWELDSLQANENGISYTTTNVSFQIKVKTIYSDYHAKKLLAEEALDHLEQVFTNSTEDLEDPKSKDLELMRKFGSFEEQNRIIELLETNVLLKEVFEVYVNATGNKYPELVEYLSKTIRENNEPPCPCDKCDDHEDVDGCEVCEANKNGWE